MTIPVYNCAIKYRNLDEKISTTLRSTVIAILIKIYLFSGVSSKEIFQGVLQRNEKSGSPSSSEGAVGMSNSHEDLMQENPDKPATHGQRFRLSVQQLDQG